MSVEKTDIQDHVETALSGLKDFQTATVEVVHKRLFGDRQKSMLVADEVGLGKTIVAKGIIARELMARQRSKRRGPFKVTYICSNQVIAGENIRKLNLFPEKRVVERLAQRIAFLAYDPVNNDAPFRDNLVLNTLTPGTSFRVSNSLGTKDERSIIYSLLCADKVFLARKNGLSWLLRGGVQQEINVWRKWLDKKRKQPLRPDLPERFLRLMRRCRLDRKYVYVYEALEEKKTIKLEDATYRLAGILRANNEKRHHRACLELAKALRRLLVDACLEYVDADLYILDEFQRFRNLIDLDSEDEEALIAHRVFKQKRARILLLSATPFKAYTGDLDQANGEDHYRDFRVVLQFLTGNDENLLQTYDYHRAALYRQLLRLEKGNLDLSSEHRAEVETVLRKFMCRTERHSVATDPGAMIADCWQNERLPFNDADIYNFTGTDHIASALVSANKGGRHSISKPVEYCKSAPYPLSFLDGYMLKKRLSLCRRLGAVKTALRKNRRAWLDLRSIDAYAMEIGTKNRQSGHTRCTHARLAQLVDKAVGADGAGLLWIPPSNPYYPMEGAFRDASGFSKTLVFSAWVMVPRMIASLVSYEVERRTVGNPATQDEREDAPRTYFAPSGKKNYRRHPGPLLTFSRAEEGDERMVQNMSNFGLLYPSPTLARAVTIPELVTAGMSLPELRMHVTQRMSRAIEEAGLTRFVHPSGESDKWYWAAAPLLDRASSSIRRLVQGWMYDSELQDNSRFFLSKGADGSAKTQHFKSFREAFNKPHEIGLGRIPSDLAEVLAEMAIGSPAVVAARSLACVIGSTDSPVKKDMRDAFNVAVEFLNLFNKPESITSIRLAVSQGTFWWKALRYCVEGCLQSVVDEYLHLLKGQTEDRDSFVKDLLDTVNINVASIKVDGIDTFLTGKLQRMRCHYAVDFGNQKIETEEGQQRAKSIRANFNSPFRPFVLATTSIGQEGLDFHQYCRRIVHWNLPSNPIDLEQREGRINRYKGLVVRQQLASHYGKELRSTDFSGDPWVEIFQLADQRERVATGKCELIPYWHVDTDGFRIERCVPMYPFSRDQARLDRILKTLAIYRLAFGQPRQVELVEHLLARGFNKEEIDRICSELMVNLCPIVYGKADTPEPERESVK